MAELGRARYISITTFRRDGSPVATPVWVAEAGGRLYVWTGAQTGKVKRVRHSPGVLVAPCTLRGTQAGPAVRARALIVQAADRPEVWRRFQAKYGLQLRAIIWTEQVSRSLRRSAASPAGRVYLELTLEEG